jgi:hypothetical protein
MYSGSFFSTGHLLAFEVQAVFQVERNPGHPGIWWEFWLLYTPSHQLGAQLESETRYLSVSLRPQGQTLEGPRQAQSWPGMITWATTVATMHTVHPCQATTPSPPQENSLCKVTPGSAVRIKHLPNTTCLVRSLTTKKLIWCQMALSHRVILFFCADPLPS